MPPTYHIEHRGEKQARRYRAMVYVGRRTDGPPRIWGRWRKLEREAKADGAALLESLGEKPQTDETVAELLERWLRDYAAGATDRVCGHVKPDQLTHGLRAALLRRGLPPVRLHMLRHALASSMLAA